MQSPSGPSICLSGQHLSQQVLLLPSRLLPCSTMCSSQSAHAVSCHMNNLSPVLKALFPPTLLVARVLLIVYGRDSLLHVQFPDIFLPPPPSSLLYPLWELGVLILYYHVLFVHLYYNSHHNSTLLQVSVCMYGIPGNSKPLEEYN